MSSKTTASTLKKILDHPDKDEIISKLAYGTDHVDIHEWLKVKYNNTPKLVLSAKAIYTFKKDHLDIYNIIQNDIAKSYEALKTNNNLSDEEKITSAIQGNPTYQQKLLELTTKEVDVKQMAARLAVMIEHRFTQVFDEIQEDPRNINTRIDRLLIEYVNSFSGVLEKLHKFANPQADIVIQNNLSVQVVDQHISVFHDVIREILSSLDLEASMKFMELLNEKMSKLKESTINATYENQETKLAEAKFLNDQITKKLSDI